MSKNVFPQCKLWLSNDDSSGIFGGGKWRLLKAIDQTGSLKAAAAELGISYRKAWGDLKKAEEQLKLDLITRHRGGAQGGKTELTTKGRELLIAYDQYHSACLRSVRELFQTHLKKVVS